ncbi:hypothetical protein HRED_03824, partial [Candidatus Haloredivivus sp. G17]
TEQYDVGYRINIEDLEMESSSALIDVDTANERYGADYGGDCEALNYEGDGVYTVNMESSSAQNIKAQQENRWFSRGAGPSPFRCDMIIDPGESNTGPVSTITPTGETLTMRADRIIMKITGGENELVLLSGIATLISIVWITESTGVSALAGIYAAGLML